MQSSFPSEGHTKYLTGNALVCADNIDVLKSLPNDCIDLIYLDPPFNSNQNYVAVFGDKGQVDAQLKDIWKWTVETHNSFDRMPFGLLRDSIRGIILQTGEHSRMAAYAVFMAKRLAEMHRVLKPTGSLYLHCDPTAAHYLRILLDAVFGERNFLNDIVWYYRGAGVPKKSRAKRHDVILWYAKHQGKHVFDPDPVRLPYADATEERFKHYIGNVRQGHNYGEQTLNPKGKHPDDVISHIQPIAPSAKERLGYPTQKPLSLLEDLIKSSTKKGGMVLDPFCGCGTAADAAAKLGRKYLGVDISAIAVRVMEQRLTSRGKAATPTVHGMEWSDYDWEQFEKRALMGRDVAEDGTPGWAWAEDKVAGLLNAVPNAKKTGDGGVDARYYGASDEVIPIQVKMRRSPIGRPDMDKLLGAQTAMNNRGIHAPMSLMVSLYPVPRNLRSFAAEQGRVTLADTEYPVMQTMSVQEMLTKGERPTLPPVDPRSIVGSTQTRMVMGA